MEDKKNQRAYPDELHRELGMTPEEVNQSYVDEGIDPKDVVAEMRRLGRVMAARYAPQVAEEARQAGGFPEKLPMFQEAVAAGSPAWADGASPVQTASLRDVMAAGDPEHTALARVSGWSMRDEGINDGDYVIVNTRLEANDGDIVLAHIEGEGQVVKRLSKGPDGIRLKSANSAFADIVVDDPSRLRIQGVVVGRAGKL